MKTNFAKAVRSQKSEVRSQTSGGRNLVGTCAPQNGSGLQPSTFNLQPSRRGFALIITLILLSVTLVMAVAFLAISRRERGSVTTATDTTTARLAADTALANAEAQIMSTVLANTNPFINNLIVSTNYINASGFQSSSSDPTNVNYTYGNGNPINNDAPNYDFERNVANLQYLPRVPVFVPTNNLGSNEFRFYVDLNRNGKFEDSGAQPQFGPNGGFLHPNGAEDNNPANVLTNFQVGDPQWIGVLERPDAPHGPNNKFVSRYAFIALPAGNGLDLNAIHNQALHGSSTLGSSGVVNPSSAGDVFFRNQGVGSWEINLAAFLADLNTNQWGQIVGSGPGSPIGSATYYQYNQLGNANLGNAFDDSRALLAYRYNNNFGSLAFLPTLYQNYLLPGSVDIMSIGPTMITPTSPFYYNTQNILNNYLWPGANNTNHFFVLTSDLFDTNKNSAGFNTRLDNADNAASTYDRYTYYRLLSQLGTDSSADDGKINLNYDNLDPGLNPATHAHTSPVALTNFMAWAPLAFFTNAADRMLRMYSTNWFVANPTNYLQTYYNANPAGYLNAAGNGVTNVQYLGQTNQIPAFGIYNIPVYVNGRFVYSSSVQRVLQLAANIYDASVTNFYPSVYRPVFWVTNQFGFKNIYINGYTNLNSGFGVNTIASSVDLQLSVFDIPTILSKVSPGPVPLMDNIYGIPWIVGAKKGLPNFNEFSMQDVVQVTRLLQVTRLTTDSLPNGTNQMYLFGITNSLGVEFWNSYTNGYSNQVQVVVNDRLTMQMALTNGTILSLPYNPNPSTFILNTSTNVIVWPGRSFVLPLNTNVAFLPNSQIRYAASASLSPVYFDYVGNNPNPSFQTITPNSFANLPQIVLQTTNQLQAFVLDTTGNHVIDYVSFDGPQSTRNLNSEIFNTNTAVLNLDQQYTNLVWSTALDNATSTGNPLGIDTQINISSGAIGLDQTYWKSPPQAPGTVPDEIDGFKHFLNPKYATTSKYPLYTTNLAVQVPYAPSISTYEYITWQANDPLVHHLQSDLNFTGADPQNGTGVQTGVHRMAATSTTPLPLLPDLGRKNARYQPWSIKPPTVGTGISQVNYDENPFNLAFKDPLMTQSDNWNFPTNKYPTVGWLGRVHRGTPWQTVYLKASNILDENNSSGSNIGTNTWAVWTGNYANPIDATNTAPVQDRLLFDVFSTAPNDNASRGTLSVNVAADPKDPRAGLAAWSALFSGMVALTNTTVAPPFHTLAPLQASNSWLVISPAGTTGLNSPLGQLVEGIYRTRTNITLFPKRAFEHVGDLLAVPQLTEQSPFLNWNNLNQQQQGISDEVYEWLPQQTLSLLRDSGNPRYVIYCYGQTLKPAPNGVVTSGATLPGGLSPFGMVTNYQVVAETATRAVVQFKSVVVTNSLNPLRLQTNYSATLEQFNPLPPD